MNKIMHQENELIFSQNIFLPVSWYINLWFLFVNVILLLDFAFTVVFICFQSSQASDGLRDGTLPILAAVCGLDIIITLNTSFIRDGKLIQTRKQILNNYLLSLQFFLDILAFIIAICQLILRYQFYQKYTFLNFLIFIKIIKVHQYDRMIKKYVIKSPNGLLVYALVKNLVLLTLVCHVIGSFFYFIDLKLIQSDMYSGMLWIQNSYAFLNINQLQSMFYRYSYGFYYAVVTLTGTAYGDLTPLNPIETIYTFMAVAMPMIIYAYLFSVIYNAISERRKKSIDRKKAKTQAKYYFRDIGLSQNESLHYMNYISYIYDGKISLDNQFIDNIAPSVKNAYLKQIIEKDYDFSLFNILAQPYFQKQKIRQFIYPLIDQDMFPQKQFINLVKRKKLFFITSGGVHKIMKLNNKFKKKIKQKQFIGKFYFFTSIYSESEKNLIQTYQFTICQAISFQKFNSSMKQPQNYPLFQSYHLNKHKLLFQGETRIIKQMCYFCDSQEHMVHHCDKLSFNISMDLLLRAENLREIEKNKNDGRKAIFANWRKIFRSSVKSKKIIHKSIFKDKFSLEKNKNQKGIQVQNFNITESIRKREFEIIHNWKIFFSEDNISTYL